MYKLIMRRTVEKMLLKLAKKDKKKVMIIGNKITEILKNPHHFKNLRKPLHHLKRIHVDKSYVLVYSVDDNLETVTIEDYGHHDNIYKK